MEIKVLGCSGGIGAGLKTTSFLVDDSLLVDAGTGVELLTLEQMLNIRDVVITHAHLDHIVGLPLMLSTIFDAHQQSVNVYALPEVIEALQQHVFNWVIWPDFTQLPEQAPILTLTSVQQGQELQLQGKTLRVLPAEHPTPTVGYFVDDGQSSFAFSGDTGVNDALWPRLNQLQPNLLIIDVSFTDDEVELAQLSGHLTPALLAQQLAAYCHDGEVRITHMKPGFEEMIAQACQNLLPGRQLQPLVHGELIRL